MDQLIKMFYIKLVKPLAKISLYLFLSSLLILIIGMVSRLIPEMVDDLPNKNAILFDILNIDILNGIKMSFFIFVLVLMIYLTIICLLLFFQVLLHINTERVMYLLPRLIVPIYITMFLASWLDENTFMIITSVISFAALLGPASIFIENSQEKE